LTRASVPFVATETSQTLDRGLRLLEILAEEPSGFTVTDLAHQLDVARPVVYRLLATLDEHGFVQRSDDGRIRLGLGLISLAAHVHPVLVRAATPILRDVADRIGATAQLVIADGSQALTMAVEEPRWTDFHVKARVGSRHPLDRGAAGKAVVHAQRHEPTLVKTVGELQPGAHAMAIPVIGLTTIAASIGVVSMTDLQHDQVGPILVEAAKALAAALS
jgi:DNA-binding IclR family transcriptional regulator